MRASFINKASTIVDKLDYHVIHMINSANIFCGDYKNGIIIVVSNNLKHIKQIDDKLKMFGYVTIGVNDINKALTIIKDNAKSVFAVIIQKTMQLVKNIKDYFIKNYPVIVSDEDLCSIEIYNVSNLDYRLFNSLCLTGNDHASDQ